MRILISGRNGLSLLEFNNECSGSLATEISVVPVSSNVIIIRGR